MTSRFIKILIDHAAAPYRAAGRFAWHFARGKLGGDPVFAGLLEHGLIPDQARLLDIGCGQGLLASWLLAARALYEQGNWPAQWPLPPLLRTVHGIELMPRDVQRAQLALGSSGNSVTFTAGDMRKADFGAADVAVILDVLHYVDFAAQEDVLLRVRRALSPGGRLLLRVGDAGAGLPFKASVWVDHVVTFVRGHRNARLYCRPLADWHAALEKLGFSVTAQAMNRGTPFANMLLIATLASHTSAG